MSDKLIDLEFYSSFEEALSRHALLLAQREQLKMNRSTLLTEIVHQKQIELGFSERKHSHDRLISRNFYKACILK